MWSSADDAAGGRQGQAHVSLDPYADTKRRFFHRTWPVVLIIATALLLSHPFTGIRHDGTLYAGEALARLLPGEFRDDLYFLFGSQGRFTLLPALYAQLISAFGIGTGTLVGMLLALAMYLAATAYLITWFAPPSLRVACVLTVVLGWTIYGGNRIFAYSEPFLTARSFAEPVMLLGLGLFLRGRRVWAGFAFATALAIHPLIAASGCVIAWLLMLRQDRRWLGAGLAAIAALLVLGATGTEPFADVFSRYDDQWLALVHEANGHAFVLRWSILDYGIVVFNLVVLWFAARAAEQRPVLDFIVAVAIVGLGSTLISIVLVDLLLNPFFGKLQIWRAGWIMQWVAMASVPMVVTSLWKKGEEGRVKALLLALGWAAPFSVAPGVLAILAAAIDLLRRGITITSITTRIVATVAALAALLIAIQYEARVFKFGALLDLSFNQIAGQALAMNLILLVLALLFVRFLPKLGWVGPLLATAAFAGSLILWDQRGAWTRRLESYPAGTHIWPGLIDSNAKVYWYRDLIAPWVLLGHGNYYTQQHGSGAVFSREMTIELDKRRKTTAILDLQEQICRMMNGLNEKQAACEPDVAAVRTLCDDGGIDYVVLQSTLEGATPLAQFSTGVVESGYEKKFFLYRCSALNQR